MDAYNELKQRIDDATDESTMVRALLKFWQLELPIEQCFELLDKAITKGQQMNSVKVQADCLRIKAHYCAEHNQFEDALGFNQQSFEFAEQAEDKKRKASALFHNGMIHNTRGEYDQGLNNFFQVLGFLKLMDDPFLKAKVNNSIALIAAGLGDYDKGVEYCLKNVEIGAQLIEKKKADPKEVKRIENYLLAECYQLLGSMYNNTKESDKAIEYASKSLAIVEESKIMVLVCANKVLIARANLDKANYPKAIEYYQSALHDLESSPNVKLQARALSGLGLCFARQGNAEEGIKLIEQGLDITKDKQLLEDAKEISTELSEVYAANNQKDIAYDLLLESREMEQQIKHGKTSKALQERESSQIIEHKEKEIELLHAIEQKHIEIQDSINYAQRIQAAFLPEEDEMKAALGDSFVLFMPKDVVSGDFYWADKVDNKALFSVVDCTGHGVPGSLVSIVGHNGLTRAVNEKRITTPGLVMDALNEIVEHSFGKIKDGMDMALCTLDREARVLEFAGAKNPVYLIQHGELIEIKADKQPIEANPDREPYTTHTINVNPGDVIYLFSDGFSDQFGGPKGKKFKYKPFKELLVEIHQKPMEQQLARLNDAFTQWIGEYEQIDDVCVLGVRV